MQLIYLHFNNSISISAPMGFFLFVNILTGMVRSVCKINKLGFFIHERVLTIKQFNYLL